MLRTPGFFLALAGLVVMIATAKEEVKEDVLEVRCSPPVGINGYEARMYFRIERPKKLYCPSVTIHWSSEVKAGPRSADCDPLPEGEVGEPWSSADLWPHGLWFQVPPGRHVIYVDVSTSEMFVRGECIVEATE